MAVSSFAQNWSWAVPVGGNGGDALTGLTVNSSGEAWASGSFQGQINLGGDQLNSIGDADVFLARLNADGSVNWIRRGGSLDDDDNGGVAIDDQNNAFVAGRYWDEADFGSVIVQREQGSNSALYLVKYGPDGTALDGISIDGSGIKVLADVGTDLNGNVYLTGYFGDQLFVEDETLTAGGDTDVFTLKFSNTLELLWARRAGTLRDVRGVSLAVHVDGTVYVAGNFMGAFDFAGATISTNTVDADAFILKYDNAGNEVWGLKAGGVQEENCRAVALDASGNIYLGGFFIGVLNFPPLQIESPGFNQHIFLAKLAPDGTGVWARSIGSTNDEFLEDIAVDGNRLLLSGYFSNSTDLDGIQLSTDPVRTDAFLAQYDLLGNIQFAKQVGVDANFDLATQVAVLPGGDPFLGGIFEVGTLFDDQSVPSFGGFDGFVARLGVTTSTVEVDTEQVGFTVFPNPFSDYLEVRVRNKRNAEVAMQVFDVNGRLVFEEKGRVERFIIDSSSWSMGVYLIEVKVEGRRGVRKVVGFE